MKSKIFILILLFAFVLTSCSTKNDFGEPEINPENIEKNFSKWWLYHSENIILSKDFIPISESNKVLDKKDFFEKLVTGNYIPLKLNSKDVLTYYKLYKLSDSANKSIVREIKGGSKTSFKHFKMEGKKFPEFNFTDLKGVSYNSKNTLGKLVVVKCWFIHCVACIKEFPELNELVKINETNENVLFISLAEDNSKDLKHFLSKTPLNYSTIPEQKGFMKNNLKVKLFPTHIVIGKDGKIKKMVNYANELFEFLEKEGLNVDVEIKDVVKIPPPR